MPEYNPSTPTHFNYIYELVKLLSRELDIFLVIEKGIKPDFLSGEKYYVQKLQFLPLRILENFFVVFYARMRGYSDFYIHYSFLSAFNASFVTKFLKGRTFYWNCGLPWQYPRNFLRKLLEQLIYQMITLLVTGTENLKIKYANHYRIPLNKIRVMPNWIDLGSVKRQVSSARINELKYRLNIAQDTRVVLFVHRLSRRKGAHYLAEIVNKIRDEKAVTVIIGDGPEKEDLEFKIRALGLKDRARFLGWVSNQDALNYFAIADVFIMPSEEEGFPHVLLESMAMGIPFVASRVGGVQDITPEAAHRYLVTIGDTLQFADKIHELLHKDSEELRVIKNLLVNWVKRYDILNSVKNFKELILHN